MKRILFLLLLISNTAVSAPNQCQNLFQPTAARPFTRPLRSLPSDVRIGDRRATDRAETIDNAPRKANDGDSSTWQKLRRAQLLVNQNSIPGRADLCATACAVNVLQAAAMKAGLEPLHNPQGIFEKFVKDHVPTGGADIGETVTRLRMLLDARFKNRAPNVHATFLRGLNQDVRLASEVTSMTLEDLKPERNKLKLIMTAQFDADNRLVMQHAQIVESIVGKNIKLIEPNAPGLDIAAEARGVFEVNGIRVPHLHYLGNELTGLKSFAVIGIITVEVKSEGQ